MSMVTKRPQLSLDELHQLKWLLGSVLATLSAWTVFFMEVEAWVLLTLITVAGGVVLVRPAWPARVPRWVHRLAFPVIVVFLIYDLQVHREPLPAFIRLNLMLILYRLIGHRRRREDLQLIVLGLFMVVVAGVITVSLAFALQILAFTACALAFLLTVTLADAAGSGPAPVAHPGGPPHWAVGVRWTTLGRRLAAVTDWRLVVLGGTLFAGVVVLSGLMFLAIPRFELNSGFFLDRLMSRKTHTGFSDEIKFGEVTEIMQDDGLALMVDVDDPELVPSRPYWRMVVLDEYVEGGFRLSPAVRSQLDRMATRTSRVGGTARFRPEVARWTFYLEAGVSRYLPLLGNFTRIQFTESQMVGINDSLKVVALQRDPPKMLAYRVAGMDFAAVIPDESLALKRQDPLLRELTLPPRGELASADQTRMNGIVTEITGGRELSAAVFATLATQWLQDRHGYGLSSALPPGPGDPLVRWMDSETPGHCELFAGALVMLARQAGLPARFVAGFRGGSWNGFSGSYVVRNSDAHAWVEIFDDAAGGWLRVDPTPGAQTVASENDDERGEAALLRIADNSWSARLESLRVFWYRRIVNFDQTSQIELARTVRQKVSVVAGRVRNTLDAFAGTVKSWALQPWDFGRLGLVAGLAAAMAGLVYSWKRYGLGWWLRWHRGRPRSVGADPVRREAGRWLHRLARLDAREGERDLRSDLQRLRYGSRASWPNPARVFREAKQVQRLRRR